MAPLGCYFLPDQPLHLIQRGNNRQAISFDDDDDVHYRSWLAEAAAEYGCVIHAYADNEPRAPVKLRQLSLL